MERAKWRNRQVQWDYAMSLLKEHNIKPIDRRMTFSGKNCYHLVIHSKDLCNCIIIGAYDTNEQIKKKIDMQVKISKEYLKNRERVRA